MTHSMNRLLLSCALLMAGGCTPITTETPSTRSPEPVAERCPESKSRVVGLRFHAPVHGERGVIGTAIGLGDSIVITWNDSEAPTVFAVGEEASSRLAEAAAAGDLVVASNAATMLQVLREVDRERHTPSMVVVAEPELDWMRERIRDVEVSTYGLRTPDEGATPERRGEVGHEASPRSVISLPSGASSAWSFALGIHSWSFGGGAFGPEAEKCQTTLCLTSPPPKPPTKLPVLVAFPSLVRSP